MKKSIIIAGLFVLVTGTALHAQVTSSTPTFGVKAGLNASKFAGDPDPDSEFNTGFAAGLFVNIPMSSGFSFEPSAEYSQKGAEYTFGNTEYKQKISYIDISVIFKYNVTPQFGVFAGPQVSFFVDQENKIVNTNNNNSVTFDPNTDALRKSLAGGKIGLSYSFGSVGINASYATDFQKIYKDENNNPDIKNQVINLGLAYSFK